MAYFQIEEVMSVNTKMPEKKKQDTESFGDENLAICPACGKKSLRVEGGCHSCINPKCGYSKCDT
jgi:hypothetical protein